MSCHKFLVPSLITTSVFLPYSHALLLPCNVVQSVLRGDPLYCVFGETADREERLGQSTLRHLREEISLVLDLVWNKVD